jgi:hypothetical protein
MSALPVRNERENHRFVMYWNGTDDSTEEVSAVFRLRHEANTTDTAEMTEPNKQEPALDQLAETSSPLERSTMSEKSVFARIRDNTALFGLSIAMALPQLSSVPHSGPTVSWVESTATTAEDRGALYSFASASTSEVAGTQQTVAFEVLSNLRQAASEADGGGTDARLIAFMEEYLAIYGSVGVEALGTDIQNAGAADYDRSANLLIALTCAGEADYREEVIDVLISFLKNPSPALRYEASATLAEMKAERSVLAIEAAANREPSPELKAYLFQASKSIGA